MASERRFLKNKTSAVIPIPAKQQDRNGEAVDRARERLLFLFAPPFVGNLDVHPAGAAFALFHLLALFGFRIIRRRGIRKLHRLAPRV